MTQTSGSVSVERTDQVKKTIIEKQLIRNVDCFPDIHGKYTINSVSFITIIVKYPFPEFQRDLYKSVGSANDTVNTPINSPNATKNAITKTTVPNGRQKHVTDL